MASAILCVSCGGVKVTLLKQPAIPILFIACVSGKQELFGFRESGHQLVDCTAGSPASPSMIVPGSVVSKQVCAEQDFETPIALAFRGANGIVGKIFLLSSQDAKVMSLEYGVYQSGYAVTLEIGVLALSSPDACATALVSEQYLGIQDGLSRWLKY